MYDDSVLDYGNEIEMRAVFKRQRQWLIPTFFMWTIVFSTMALFISVPRWTTGERPINDLDAVCMGVAVICAVLTTWQSFNTYESWIKGWPQVARIASA